MRYADMRKKTVNLITIRSCLEPTKNTSGLSAAVICKASSIQRSALFNVSRLLISKTPMITWAPR